MFKFTKLFLAIQFWTATFLFVLVLTTNSFASDYTIPIFQNPRLITVGSCNYRVEPADFNSDSKPDLAVTSACDDSVYVLWGDGTGNFPTRTQMPAGSNPIELVARDFNGDNKLDLAVISQSNELFIYLGDGVGGFNQPRISYAGSSPVRLAAADFNSDGKIDLATTEISNRNILILSGDGAGNFTISNTFHVSGLDYIVTADINADGKADIVTSNDNYNGQSEQPPTSHSLSIAVFYGDGTGHFSAGQYIDLGSRTVKPAVADVNSDGRLDIATALDTNEMVLLLNNGNGQFTEMRSPIGEIWRTDGDNVVRIADLNSDGKADLVLQSSFIAAALGDGQGNFGPVFRTNVGGEHDVNVADLNGDGKPDLIGVIFGGHTQGYLSVQLSSTNSDGNDTTPPTITVPADITTDATGASGAVVHYSVGVTDDFGGGTLSCNVPSGISYPIGTTTVTCTATDASGNTSSGSFHVTVVDTPPVLSLPENIYVTNTASYSRKAVTFSASATDVVSGNLPVNCHPPSGSTFPVGQTIVTCSATDGAGNTTSGSFTVNVQVCIGCTLPTFAPPVSYAVGLNDGEVAGYPENRIEASDFNNDGKTDIALLLPAPSNVRIYLNNGSGGFGTPVSIIDTSFDGSGGGETTAFGIADFNHDGYMDIVAMANATWKVWHGDGTGHFVQVAGSQSAGCYTYNEMAVADFNHDNNPDIFYGGYCAELGLGDGFALMNSPIYQYYEGFNTGYLGDVYRPGGNVGDFNGDGNLDFVSSAGENFLGNGAGDFIHGTGIGAGISTVGDFNGDGKTDIAYAFNAGGDYFSVQVSTSQSTSQSFQFAPPAEYQLPGIEFFPSDIKSVDINGDGKLDIVTAKGSKIHVLLGKGDGTFGSLLTFPGGTGFGDGAQRMAIGDFNGDGKPDIAELSGDGAANENPTNSRLTILLNTTYQTSVGQNTTVILPQADFTFDNVTAGGTTSVTSIDAATAGDVPGGFALADLAFEVSTTATFTGSVTTCFNVPTINDQPEFNNLRVLHNENGTLVDRTSSHDYPSRRICAATASFSPFYLATVSKKVQSLFDRSRAFKAGSTVPVKVKILNQSSQNISAATLVLTARSLRRIGSNTTSSVTDAGNSNPDFTFRYDSALQGYIYNLKTTGLVSGRYVLSFYAGSDRAFFYTVEFEVK